MPAQALSTNATAADTVQCNAQPTPGKRKARTCVDASRTPSLGISARIDVAATPMTRPGRGRLGLRRDMDRLIDTINIIVQSRIERSKARTTGLVQQRKHDVNQTHANVIKEPESRSMPFNKCEPTTTIGEPAQAIDPDTTVANEDLESRLVRLVGEAKAHRILKNNERQALVAALDKIEAQQVQDDARTIVNRSRILHEMLNTILGRPAFESSFLFTPRQFDYAMKTGLHIPALRALYWRLGTPSKRRELAVTKPGELEIGWANSIVASIENGKTNSEPAEEPPLEHIKVLDESERLLRLLERINGNLPFGATYKMTELELKAAKKTMPPSLIRALVSIALCQPVERDWSEAERVWAKKLVAKIQRRLEKAGQLESD